MSIQIDTLERPVQIDVRSSTPVTLSGQFGQPGPAGAPGGVGPAGPNQVFYQASEPPYTGTPWLWFETNGSDDVVNLWINDGNA